MNTFQQLILPTLIIPVVLSGIAWWVTRMYRPVIYTLPLVWILPCLWITGIPTGMPAEAKHWLPLMLMVSAIAGWVFCSRRTLFVALQSILLILLLSLIAYPIVKNNFHYSLLPELALASITGIAIIASSQTVQSDTRVARQSPALVIAISSAALSVVVMQSGSLLIAQLAGSLAALVTAFALHELISKLQRSALSTVAVVPLVLLWLGLLVTARLFQDTMPTGPSLLLLASIATGLVIRRRFAVLISLLSSTAAVVWVLLTTDSKMY